MKRQISLLEPLDPGLSVWSRSQYLSSFAKFFYGVAISYIAYFVQVNLLYVVGVVCFLWSLSIFVRAMLVQKRFRALIKSGETVPCSLTITATRNANHTYATIRVIDSDEDPAVYRLLVTDQEGDRLTQSEGKDLMRFARFEKVEGTLFSPSHLAVIYDGPEVIGAIRHLHA